MCPAIRVFIVQLPLKEYGNKVRHSGSDTSHAHHIHMPECTVPMVYLGLYGIYSGVGKVSYRGEGRKLSLVLKVSRKVDAHTHFLRYWNV